MTSFKLQSNKCFIMMIACNGLMIAIEYVFTMLATFTKMVTIR